MDELSAKARGKRRMPSPELFAHSQPVELSAAKKAKPQSTSSTSSRPGTPTQAAVRVTRTTRSSLGGAKLPGESSSSAEVLPPAYLPSDTAILLTLSLPAGLTHHPPGANDPASLPRSAPSAPSTWTGASAGPANGQPDELTPIFRLLGPSDTFGRLRHAGASEFDTSDAYYQRLHRFPEVLEKRSARLEIERLIHERSKLILELEQLRAKAKLYPGTAGEADRNKKLAEAEARLKRYDDLLPNQPRKSNALSQTSNAHLPAQTAPSARSVSPLATDRPISATGTSGMTIKFKFANGQHAPPKPQPQAQGKRPRVVHRYESAEESSDDLSSVESDDDNEPPVPPPRPNRNWGGNRRGGYVPGLTKAGAVKRDRRGEIARREERKRLGIPPRTSIDKHIRLAAQESSPNGRGTAKSRDRTRSYSSATVDSLSESGTPSIRTQLVSDGEGRTRGGRDEDDDEPHKVLTFAAPPPRLD